jgi:hypothetical protein
VEQVSQPAEGEGPQGCRGTGWPLSFPHPSPEGTGWQGAGPPGFQTSIMMLWTSIIYSQSPVSPGLRKVIPAKDPQTNFLISAEYMLPLADLTFLGMSG